MAWYGVNGVVWCGVVSCRVGVTVMGRVRLGHRIEHLSKAIGCGVKSCMFECGVRVYVYAPDPVATLMPVLKLDKGLATWPLGRSLEKTQPHFER
jgi:hypothetical protein